jgi:hypothetical protein
MLVVLKTLGYLGDASAAPFSGVELEVQVPVFGYEDRPNEPPLTFVRHVQGTRSIPGTADLPGGWYRSEIPTEHWLGSTSGSTYDFYRYHRIEPRLTDSLDAYTIPIDARVTALGIAGTIARARWTAIYGERVSDPGSVRSRLWQPADVDNRYGTRHQPNEAEMANVRQAVARDGFLIN